MTMHIYAFGSICRGDIDKNSDIDLIAIVEGFDDRFDPSTFSIYSYKRIKEIWNDGNPFAWHLATEARLVFSSDQSDFLLELGVPNEYRNMQNDCEKFARIFNDAAEAIEAGTASIIYELSAVFLAIRNFSTCYSLGTYARGDFSRSSARRLEEAPVPISVTSYSILERARILSTRGKGEAILPSEINSVISELDSVDRWMNNLLGKIK